MYKLSSDSKEQVTVLACVSARGNFSKPFVLFPGVKLPKINFHEVNEANYDVGYSQNGWMSTDCFVSWIANLFYPSIQDKVSFPVILFVDGHISHMSLPVAEFCRDHGIILYCFPLHASHIIQPLDVTVFGPVKKLEPPVQVTKSENIAQQKVGISMAFGKITEILSDEQLTLFEKKIQRRILWSFRSV